MRVLRFFGDELAARYGRKLHRIPVDLALGCPNRPGRFGPGCSFCAEDGARARHLARNLDLPEQVARGVKYVRERYDSEGPYIAYFQAFTSTHAPVERLRALYETVLNAADFRVVIVGTRPDALEPETIAYLRELASRYEMWVELGVQSAHDITLERVNRGHDFAAVQRAARALADAGISLAAHVILGLPGEDEAMMLETARAIARLPFRALKLHQLQLLRGAPLARELIFTLNEYEYAHLARAFLRELPDDWLIMRLAADAAESELIAPRWEMPKGRFIEFFLRYFESGEIFPRVTTADGSVTLYHPEFRQHFHSLAGAETESEKKFIEPAHLAKRLQEGDKVDLLEFGFGLGGNAWAAAECARRTGKGKLLFRSLELDMQTVCAALEIVQEPERRVFLQSILDTGAWRSEYCDVELFTGDARRMLLEHPDLWDVVFMDGFSPDVNPELWSYDLVRALKKQLRPGGVLVSYVAAYPFRGALLRAGFAVGETPAFGRRRGGTIAGVGGEWELSSKELGIILHSTAGVPYRDPGLRQPRALLAERRERVVRRLRSRGVPKWFRASTPEGQ